MGVMFIATRGGEPVAAGGLRRGRVHRPVFAVARPHRPPGGSGWWYYRQAYEREFADGDLEFPCRTPCMLHVWTVDHPESVYAHDAPPAGRSRSVARRRS